MKVSSGLVSLALCGTIQGFIPCSRSNRSIRLSNGGKGWDNDSYLNNLGGTEEDRERAKNEYKEFQESRQAFLERQKSLTDNSRVQQFMQERSRMESIQWEENPVDEMTESNQQGGSRFYRMMQQSKNRHLDLNKSLLCLWILTMRVETKEGNKRNQLEPQHLFIRIACSLITTQGVLFPILKLALKRYSKAAFPCGKTLSLHMDDRQIILPRLSKDE